NIYVGLFVDSHSGKDHVNRKLVTFPDASSVRTIKMNACYSQQVCADSIPFDNIGFFDAAGNLVASWDVTGILSSVVARRQEWVHLGFQINKLTTSQTKVDIYINGYRFTEWYSSQGLIFKLTEDGSPINTPITIGASAENNGFLGWIDEFKVILQAQNPELACNHALGTLIGVDDESRDEWKSVADSFGGPLVNSSHDLITGLLQANKSKFYSQYACFHDYRGDHMATRN